MSSSPIDVTMPQMGVSVVEGTVAAWHKQVGDRVESDETICEISTDKIDTDVPAPAGGRVAEVLVAEGETVGVGTVLARIEVESLADGDVGGDAGVGGVRAVPAACAPKWGAPAGAGREGPGLVGSGGAAGGGVVERAGGGGAGHSPVVQRMAAEHGIELAGIRGTGRDGRVRKQDVMAAIEAGATGSVPGRSGPGR
ncbi:MAG: hypothetical protein QOE27_2415, partial [Solirubrobacteraceae bacterium]|nr:hypothetical protein [Solirubrobacteraceae bacterium]